MTGLGRRILVVEDEVFIGDALVAGLRHAGFDVRSVTTGGSALDEARSWSPELLLLDVMLPDMSGFDVCRTLVTEGSNAGVIFLTARDAVSDRMHGFGVGADDYVPKSQVRLQRFVSDAGHELRTPLTSIRAYAELLRRGAVPPGAGSEQASQRIEAEAERMSTLVNDLLLLARLDEQRSTEPSRVDLGQLVAEMATDIAMTAPTHDVTCQVEADTSVLGDEPQLRQLDGNLLRNAVVHTPPATSVQASVSSRGGDVVLVVVDDGPGMPPDVAEHAFERFFRPEAGRTRGSGSGLGLAIVEAIAISHGGTVDLESGSGGGARFTITLPRMPGRKDTRATAEPLLRSAGASP
jgi:signal transduction histidine kinase